MDADRELLAAYKWLDQRIAPPGAPPLAPRLHNPMEVQVAANPPARHGRRQATKKLTIAQRLRRQFKHRKPLLLAQLLERDGRVCMHCHDPIPDDEHGPDRLTVEHIVALNAGGSNDLSNLGLAHRRCNR